MSEGGSGLSDVTRRLLRFSLSFLGSHTNGDFLPRRYDSVLRMLFLGEGIVRGRSGRLRVFGRITIVAVCLNPPDLYFFLSTTLIGDERHLSAPSISG